MESPGLTCFRLPFVADRFVRAVQVPTRLAVFDRGSMVQKVYDGQFGSELRNPACVIRVIVRDDQIIDVSHAGVSGDLGDPIGVAVANPA